MTSTAVRPVTVFCADDRSYFRDALREVVAATPGLTHVGEAASGEEAVRSVEALRPDIVLMDVRMPGLNGLEAAAILAEPRRDVLVILTSADPFEFPREFAPRGGQVVFVPKQSLCPRVLLDLWHGRRTR